MSEPRWRRGVLPEHTAAARPHVVVSDRSHSVDRYLSSGSCCMLGIGHARPGLPHVSKDTPDDELVPVENALWLASGVRRAGAADRADVRSRPSSGASLDRYGSRISSCIRRVKLTRSRPKRSGRLRLPDLCVDQIGRDLDPLGAVGSAASGLGRFRHAATPCGVGVGNGTALPAQGPRAALNLRRAP